MNNSPSTSEPAPNQPEVPPQMQMDAHIAPETFSEANASTQHNQTSPEILPHPWYIRYLRRLGCGVVVLIWLVCMASPCFIITLLVRGEVIYSLSNRPEHTVRVFLIQGEGQSGLGFGYGELTQEEVDGKFCIRTRVNYLMWQGEAESSDYCTCYAEIGEEQWQSLGAYQADCHTLQNFNLPDETK